MSTRPTYGQDLARAIEGGFVVDATINHYETGPYVIVGHFMVTDNSEYDGRLGVLYRKADDVGEHVVFGRPYAQMIEHHVHQYEPPTVPGEDSEPHPQPQRFVIIKKAALLTLCDEPEGEANNLFWVEASGTVEEALAVCVEEQNVRPTEEPKRVWLRPKDGDAEVWELGVEGEDQAMEFYEFDMTTAEPVG